MKNFIKLNFHSASNKGIYLQKNQNQCMGSKVPCSGSILPNWQFSKWHFCTNAWNWKMFLTKKLSYQVLCKCHLVKLFMAWPPNSGFMSIKVQTIFFFSSLILGCAAAEAYCYDRGCFVFFTRKWSHFRDQNSGILKKKWKKIFWFFFHILEFHSFSPEF